MKDLYDTLQEKLGEGILKKISDTSGMEEGLTKSALDKALPVLLEGLAKNTANPDGAEALSNALESDHDGSIFDHEDDVFANPKAAKGNGILQHILGGKTQMLEQHISQETGISQDKIAKALEMASPFLMGALGKEKKVNNMNANDLAGFLQQNSRNMEARKDIETSLIHKFLDKDGDGEILDDVVGGSIISWFKNLFGGKK